MRLAQIFFAFGALTFSLAHNSAQSKIISKGVIGVDHRVAINEPRIARLSDKNGTHFCTAFMIGQSCAMTAGHCEEALYQGEFKVPDNDRFGKNSSRGVDTYLVDQDSIERHHSTFIALDWTVFRFKKHRKISTLARWFDLKIRREPKLLQYPDTDYFPGQIYGKFPLIDKGPEIGESIRVLGFGSDEQKIFDLAPRYDSGVVLSFYSHSKGSQLYHNADTTGGVSGGPMVNENGQVLGLHTTFLCSDGNSKKNCLNAGPILYQSPILKQAIQNCLEAEAKE